MSSDANRVRNSLLMERLELVERCVSSLLGRRPWLRNNPGFGREDLVQVGVLKVAEVLDSTDVTQIGDLDAYLYVCVRHAIVDAVDQMGNSIVSTSRARTVRRFLAIQGELEERLRRRPEVSELAVAMQCSEKTVERLSRDRQVYGPLLSLDAPLSDEDGSTTLLDLVAEPTDEDGQSNGSCALSLCIHGQTPKRVAKTFPQVVAVRTMHGPKHPSFRRLKSSGNRRSLSWGSLRMGFEEDSVQSSKR